MDEPKLTIREEQEDMEYTAVQGAGTLRLKKLQRYRAVAENVVEPQHEGPLVFWQDVEESFHSELLQKLDKIAKSLGYICHKM